MSEETSEAPAGGEETTVQLQPYTEWSNQQPQIGAPPVMQEAVPAPAAVAPEPPPPPQAPEVAAQQVVEQGVPDVSDNNEQVTESAPQVNAAVVESEVQNGGDQQQPAEEKKDAPAVEQPTPSVSSVTTNGTVGVTGYKKNLRRRSEKVVYIKPDVSDDEDDTVELPFSAFNQPPKRRVKRGGRRGRKPANLRADPKKTDRLIMESSGKSTKSPNKSAAGAKPNYNSPRYSYRGLRGHYNSYTQIERLEIGRQALMNGHMATAKKFNVHESTVRDFRMKLEKHVACGRLSLTIPFEEQELPQLGKRGRPSKPKKPKPPRPRDEHGKIRRGHYKIYTQKERLEIGRHAIIHGSGATIKKYGIHESTVRDFRKKLEAYVENGLVSLTVPLEEQVLPPIGRRGRKRDPTKIRPPKQRNAVAAAKRKKLLMKIKNFQWLMWRLGKCKIQIGHLSGRLNFHLQGTICLPQVIQ